MCDDSPWPTTRRSRSRAVRPRRSFLRPRLSPKSSCGRRRRSAIQTAGAGPWPPSPPPSPVISTRGRPSATWAGTTSSRTPTFEWGTTADWTRCGPPVGEGRGTFGPATSRTEGSSGVSMGLPVSPTRSARPTSPSVAGSSCASSTRAGAHRGLTADHQLSAGTLAIVAPPLEAEVTDLARRIAELGSGERARVYRLSWWSERMLAWAMANPSFKTQLFRLVDVFPATTGDADALRHLHEYIAGADAPRLLDLGVGVAEHLPRGERLSAAVARRNIARMAQQFIVGTTPAEVADRLERLWRTGTAFTDRKSVRVGKEGRARWARQCEK